jgi:hypothetical protein
VDVPNATTSAPASTPTKGDGAGGAVSTTTGAAAIVVVVALGARRSTAVVGTVSAGRSEVSDANRASADDEGGAGWRTATSDDATAVAPNSATTATSAEVVADHRTPRSHDRTTNGRVRTPRG